MFFHKIQEIVFSGDLMRWCREVKRKGLGTAFQQSTMEATGGMCCPAHSRLRRSRWEGSGSDNASRMPGNKGEEAESQELEEIIG